MLSDNYINHYSTWNLGNFNADIVELKKKVATTMRPDYIQSMNFLRYALQKDQQKKLIAPLFLCKGKIKPRIPGS